MHTHPKHTPSISQTQRTACTTIRFADMVHHIYSYSRPKKATSLPIAAEEALQAARSGAEELLDERHGDPHADVRRLVAFPPALIRPHGVEQMPEESEAFLHVIAGKNAFVHAL